MHRLITSMAIVYPLLAHAAIVTRSEALTLAALGLLAMLVLLPHLVRGSVPAWIAAPLAVAALVGLARAELTWLPLYAPPVLVTFFVAWLFGHTLAPGRTPLVEQLVRLMHRQDEPLDPQIGPYARRLTLAWTVLLLGLGTLNLALALFAAPNGILLFLGLHPPLTVPRELWSLFAHVLNYVIIGAFFLIEYLHRRRRFPQQPSRGFVDFLRRVAAVSPQVFGARRESS